MIELLISVVIMSVGVLGMAGLQIISMQQNRSALLQGEAALKANDIMDRIQANPSTSYDGVAVTDAPGLTANCVGSTCSESEMAAYDIVQWQCSINSVDADGNPHTVCNNFGITGTMPGGFCANGTDPCAGGAISLSGNVYTVTIQWVDQQQSSAASGTVRSISVSMRAP